jgi:ubiquinone biosynthesis protein COQ9
VRARIEVNALHREAVRRTLAYLALPWNAALGAGSMYRTVNAIWYAAGDTATDIGWYSKRATLAAVYAATLLHWLDDDTEDFAATWAFLDRRIADVMRFGRLRRRIGVGFAGGRPRRA